MSPLVNSAWLLASLGTGKASLKVCMQIRMHMHSKHVNKNIDKIYTYTCMKMYAFNCAQMRTVFKIFFNNYFTSQLNSLINLISHIAWEYPSNIVNKSKNKFQLPIPAEPVSSAPWWADFGQLPGAHPATLLLPLLKRTWEENRMRNLIGQHKERLLTDYHHGQNRLDHTEL